MGFYMLEPFETAEAAYVWTGLGEPGHFCITVSGNAPNFTSGIELKRDRDFVGGLRVSVMGWTGPRGEGTTPYVRHGTFPGEYRDKIVIQGANKQVVIPVSQIPHDQTETWLKSQSAGS